MAKPIDVFIAYAERDKALMDRLRKQLSAAERIGLVDTWHDGEIEIGTDRELAAHKAMEAAEIVVLLLSADFFASEYLYEKEMAQALKLAAAKKIQLIPVLLKECTWQLTPLNKLQVLPKNEIPVTSDHWKHPDRAFKQVVDEIIDISNHIRTGKDIPVTYQSGSRTATKEVTVTKTISTSTVGDNDDDKTPLWKLALYAFAGLGALALLSFVVDQFFTSPVPEPTSGQEEEPREQLDERTGQEKNGGEEVFKEPKSPPINSSKPDFQTIKINSLEWSAQNMDTEISPSWYYKDNAGKYATYGRLYQFSTAIKLCPEGWRLPSKEEWLALSASDIARLGLKKGGVYDKGSYRQIDQIGYYFTAENTGGDLAWVIEFRGNDKPLQRDSRYQHWGMSCRCVR